MEKVVKVMMFVFREHGGEKQFFALHRHGGDNVVLTGHVGDYIAGESLEEAARREVKEELGVEAISITPIDYQTTVRIQNDTVESTEHGFFIQIPNEDVHFLEGDEPHQWYSLDELATVLTYDSQKSAIPHVKRLAQL